MYDRMTVEYFRALTQDREENAAVLEKASMRGVQRSVVEKYSEQAHFVYELIQNADDAGATYARFVLNRDCLIFAHNGTRQFTVSNPANEDQDRGMGRLGDVNAITSIANSNKTEASIGKFGVGFKAVFQYTSTPHIYCPDIAFKIERFIVPQLLQGDHPDRADRETLFVFPFDRSDMSASRATLEISVRLKTLAYPVLFLNNLQKIFYTTGSSQGEYSEDVIETYRWDDIDANLISFKSTGSDSNIDERMWLLSSVGSSGYKSTVGFFLDEEDHLTAKNVPAYCFFPTKVNTGLSFMINAPFLLTDSRESIKYSDPHNKMMIRELGSLASNALLALRDIGQRKGKRIIDDNMFSVIPYETRVSWYHYEGDELFNPMIKRIQAMLRREEIFPGENGYWRASESYVLENAPIARLINEGLLRELVGKRFIGLVLQSTPVVSMDSKLYRYLQSIGINVVNEQLLLNNLSPSFVKRQSPEQLSQLHAFFAETERRTKAVRQKAVFVDSEGAVRAAFDSYDKESLFLPSEDSDGYHVLSEESLSQEGTKRLVEAMQLQQPSLGDRIFSRVLPRLKKEGPRNENAFRAVFKYYISSDESASFVKELSEYDFIAYRVDGIASQEAAKPDQLYLPLNRMGEYFAHDHNAKFVDLDYYRSFIDDDRLLSFFERLGVASSPRLSTKSLDSDEAALTAKKTGIKWDRYTMNRKHSWNERELDGLKAALLYLEKTKDIDYSVLLWNVLVSFVDTGCAGKSPSAVLTGTFNYYYYHPQTQSYEPLSTYRLRHVAWLYDRLGNPVAPLRFSLAGISERYDTSSKAAQRLVDFLGLEEPKAQEMSDGDRLAASLDETAKMFGSSFDELKDDPEINEAIKRVIAETLRSRNLDPAILEALSGATQSNASVGNESRVRDTVEPNGQTRLKAEEDDNAHQSTSSEREGHAENSRDTSTDTGREAVKAQDEIKPALGSEKQQDDAPADNGEEKGRGKGPVEDKDLNRITEDIVKRASKRRESRRSLARATSQDYDFVEEQNSEDELQDADDYTPVEVDYSQSSERLRDKYAQQIDDLALKESLWNEAVNTGKYTYKWFKTLIALESLSDAGNSTRTEMVIAFGSVKLDEGTNRTLVLEQPSRSIPPSIEDLANIPLMLDLGDRSRNVEIEVASVRSYTLYARLKDGAELVGVDLDSVVEARIEVRNPTFLLEELRKRFVGLSYKDDLNLRDDLPSNIEFVFGPPGTGKTTYLAKNVLLPMMKDEEGLKVLVLAPTNKAADVLARKIVDCAGSIGLCLPWLVRFGMTADEYLEDSGIHRDKTYDFTSLERNVVVTTIARYPYDYVMTENGHEGIRSMDWDYVIIDEASMITCAYITYVLHNAHPRKFIIAGDPHQIAPVAKVSMWKDESIYTMTGLQSFTAPKTVPYDYPVVLLKTQYRSVPAIGTVFSEFSYGGSLSHAREDSMAVRSRMGVLLGRNAINIIRFPVSRYESIYRPKYLRGGSSYQPYSALLTFELVRYIASLLLRQDRGVSIGVVSPYKAQANLINGLLAQAHFPDAVHVQAGTIHGFQGDECDVMIVVLNPPPRTSSSKEMFLNKRNILNVSVSRARDSLILLTPDDDAPGRSNLKEIRRLEYICRKTGSVGEFPSSIIEKMIFHEPTYIADNSFTTGHQAVNVYGRPEQRYEVRSEEQAIDIQVHDTVMGLG